LYGVRKQRNNEKPAGLNRAVLIMRIERNNEGRSDSTDMKYRDIEYTVRSGPWTPAMEMGVRA
jgi:hypothetical protein